MPAPISDAEAPVFPVDLVAQHASIQADIDAALARVFASGQFILGDEVAAFEQEFAAAHGYEPQQAVACNSGTDALLLALMALGVGPGDEVVTTAYSFVATGTAILHAGATPVFVDIDPETFNLDVAQLADAITPKTKAVLPVHLFGQVADMDALLRIDSVASGQVSVIEDAAQAQGARLGERIAGAIGDYGTFSFYPTKNLGGAGDGGLLLCRDDAAAARARALRQYGSDDRITYTSNGVNSRLDALQAAILRAKLPHVPEWNAARGRLARRYREAFAALDVDAACIQLPAKGRGGDGSHCYNQFVLRVKRGRRDALFAALRERRIYAAIYYHRTLPSQPVFAEAVRERHGSADVGGAFPHATAAAEEVLALPIYPEMSDAQVQRVASAVAELAQA